MQNRQNLDSPLALILEVRITSFRHPNLHYRSHVFQQTHKNVQSRQQKRSFVDGAFLVLALEFFFHCLFCQFYRKNQTTAESVCRPMQTAIQFPDAVLFGVISVGVLSDWFACFGQLFELESCEMSNIYIQEPPTLGKVCFFFFFWRNFFDISESKLWSQPITGR